MRARRWSGLRFGAVSAGAAWGAAALLGLVAFPAPLAGQGAELEAGDRPGQEAPATGPQRIEVRVDGMTCPFCAFGLEKRLRKVDGLDSLRIDLEAGAAILYVADGARVPDARLHELVREAGFTVGAIERREYPPASSRPRTSGRPVPAMPRSDALHRAGPAPVPARRSAAVAHPDP